MLLKLAGFNVRSVVNKLHILDQYLNHAQSFDLLFITESWLNSNILNSMVCNLKYNILRDDRDCEKGGGFYFCTKNLLKFETFASN